MKEDGKKDVRNTKEKPNPCSFVFFLKKKNELCALLFASDSLPKLRDLPRGGAAPPSPPQMWSFSSEQMALRRRRRRRSRGLFLAAD